MLCWYAAPLDQPLGDGTVTLLDDVAAENTDQNLE
jgi:hypothetical protein